MSGYELANDGDVEAGPSVEIAEIGTNVNPEAERKIIKVGSTESLPSTLGERRSLMMKESTHTIGHDIVWSDLSFDVGNKRILDKCYGKVMAGQVCAIMGPSGAGKSSLLNVLAGRSSTSKDVSITGTVTVAGKKVDPVAFRKRIAYVMQDDALMMTATPREALAFSARLRLPPTTVKQEIDDLVTNTLEQLGITGCADVMIGGELIKGISGGQRKRTSIGIEIITDPALLFLDEPTSGLDSFSAQNCVELFSSISKRNVPVLCTIHQPSSEIFFLFDTVIFMKEGRIFYQGPVATMNEFFNKFDYRCPNNYNPADYVMLLSQTESMETLTNKGVFEANEAHARLIKEDIENTKESKLKFPDMVQTPFSRQLGELMYREAVGIRRNKVALIARTGITVFLNLLFGLIFLNAGGGNNADQEEFSGHYGAVTLVVISSMFGQAQPVMLAFPFERPMFLREHSTGTYSGVAYFLSKSALEFPVTFIFTLLQFIIAYFMINMQVLIFIETSLSIYLP